MVSLVPGMTVEIIVSDPWDFGTAHGAGPFKACLTCAASDPNRAMKGTAAVFKLEETRMFRDVKCEYFVAQTRHEGSDLQSESRTGTHFCEFLFHRFLQLPLMGVRGRSVTIPGCYYGSRSTAA